MLNKFSLHLVRKAQRYERFIFPSKFSMSWKYEDGWETNKMKRFSKICRGLVLQRKAHFTPWMNFDARVEGFSLNSTLLQAHQHAHAHLQSVDLMTLFSLHTS